MSPWRPRFALFRAVALALLLACAPSLAGNDPEAQVREIERLSTTSSVAAVDAKIAALLAHPDALTTEQRQRVEYVRLRNLAIAGRQRDALAGLSALLRQRMPAPLRVKVYSTAINIAANVEEWTLAFTWLDQSLRYMPLAPDEAPRLQLIAGYLYSVVGEAAKAREFTMRAVRHAEPGADPIAQCRATAGMAIVEEAAGRYPEAGSWRRRQIEACGRAGDVLFIGSAEAGMGKVDTELGKPREALSWYRKALARFRAVGYQPGVHEAEIGIAECSIALGSDPEQARTLLEASASYFRAEGLWNVVESAERLLATLAQRQGDPQGALAHLNAAMAAVEKNQAMERRRQIAYEQVKFDTQFKQQQIELLQAKQNVARLEITAARRQLWLLAAGVLILLLLAAMLFVLQKRTARERQRYRWQSEHDGLTRLLNRKQVRSVGREELAAAREQDRVLSAVVLDIDQFKQINDRHGHAAGDAVLKELGAWIERAVGDAGVAGRSGGDEFTLLVRGDAEAALAVTQTLRELIAPVTVNGVRIDFSISAGVCDSDAKQGSFEDLVNAADLALLEAKRKGRNRVELATEPEAAKPGVGQLVVVGSGIQLGRHISQRCESEIRLADVVMCLVDPFALTVIRELRPDVIQLGEHYADGKDRRLTYAEIDAAIMAQVRAGKRVCAVFYGHPGVFADVPHRVVRRAREEGFDARMEPGISAEACLYADLGVDPGRRGVQSLEATAFLCQERQLDTAGLVLLWQVALTGDLTCTRREADSAQLQRLVDKLRRWYPADHEVILYEAAQLPVQAPRIDRLRLCDLPDARYQEFTTLVILPLAPAAAAAG